jgi:peptidoglycan/xylan/chitin deacetylase (PgdA/CDA1 family)
MSNDNYPRELRGYGAEIPAANWPNDARIAMQFVINYEEGAENCVLHGDATSEAFLSEIVNAQPLPNQRNMNMESIYEYGARAGFWRLHRMFSERNLPVTVFGTEREHLQKAIRIHSDATGERPVGWYLGRCSPRTHRLVAEEGGFIYNADCYSDDLPYWDYLHGKPQLMVPYTLDANDMRFATPQGFNSGQQFFEYLKDSFDVLYAEGSRMMSIGLHCRIAGRPGRAAALARFLDYIAEHDATWITRRIDIAEHWRQQHPAKS